MKKLLLAAAAVAALGSVPTIRVLSSGMFIMWKCGKSSGSVPASGRLML